MSRIRRPSNIFVITLLSIIAVVFVLVYTFRSIFTAFDIAYKVDDKSVQVRINKGSVSEAHKLIYERQVERIKLWKIGVRS